MKDSPARTVVLYLTPTLVVATVFVLVPIGLSLYLSFWRWPLIGPGRAVVGLANYGRLLQSPEFWNALRVTSLYTLGVVPLSTAASLALALLVDRPLRGLSVYRTAFFMPVVTSTVAVAIVWKWIYNPQAGLLNGLLRAVHLPPPGWLTDPQWALPALIIMAVWKYAGYYMVMFLAGLQAIPREYAEAARIDGAGRLARFRHVTWPLLRPTTALVVITSTIFAFQVFGPVYVMTGGGPVRSTSVIVYHLYERAFGFQELGYASAMGWALFLIVFPLTVLQFKIISSR
ncbi:MAG: carbohydrate ABC transporter permease [Anaerolineae bacterium]